MIPRTTTPPSATPAATTPAPTTGRATEDGFAMVVAVVFTMLVGVLVLAGVSMVINQSNATLAERKNVTTVNAASAGMQSALATLRNAVDTDGNGVRSSLPCATSGATTLTGPTGTSTEGTTYTVRVRYYRSDPTNQSDAWLRDTANVLACPLASMPGYALLENSGASTAKPAGYGQRSLRAVYSFSTTSPPPLGGRTWVTASSTQFCWDAGAAPALGTVVTWQPCAAAGTARQLFRYRPDLSVEWMGDTTTPLCLDYRAFWPSMGTTSVTLQSCATAGYMGAGYDPLTKTFTSGASSQELSAALEIYAVERNNDNSHIGDGTNYGGSNHSSCLGPANITAGSTLVMAKTTSCATPFGNDIGYGAGAASGNVTGMPGPTKQLVNSAVGWCLDVRGSSLANKILQMYWCHQAPDPRLTLGNQQFAFSGSAGGTGTLTSRRVDCGSSATTVDSGTCDYDTACVTEHGSGKDVYLQSCVDGDATQEWRMWGNSTGSYDTNYTLVNPLTGQCLGMASFAAQTKLNTAVLQDCNGGLWQKWNAPSLVTSALTGVSETTADS